MDRIPVKSTGAVVKEDIDGLLEELYRMRLKSPVRMGEVIIRDYNNSGIDIVSTRSLLS
jgi:CxxC motif-containing protein